MTKYALCLLLFAALFADPIEIRVEIRKDLFAVAADKVRYESKSSFQNPQNVKKVKLFYINSPLSGFKSVMASIGQTFSFGKQRGENVPVIEIDLKFHKATEEVAYFMQTIQIQNFELEDLKKLQIKSILKTEEEIHFFIGELEKLSMIRLRLESNGIGKCEMNGETFTFPGEIFNQIRVGPQMQLMTFQMEKKDFPSSGFMWTSETSGFAVVLVPANKFKSFRLERPEHSNDPVRCILYPKNPAYILTYKPYQYSRSSEDNQKSSETAYGINLRSVSQDLFSESFNCPDLHRPFAAYSVGKQGSNRILVISQEKEGETLSLGVDQMESILSQKKTKSSSDYSVMLTANGGNLQVNVGDYFNENRIYFKVESFKGERSIKLMTIDKDGKQFTINIGLPSDDYKKIKLQYILTSEKAVEVVDLKLTRAVRMHTVMFSVNDYCNYLSSEPLIGTEAIKTPDQTNNVDYGAITNLSNERSDVKLWGYYVSRSKDGDLIVVLYDRKRSAFMRFNDEEVEFSWVDSYLYKRNAGFRKQSIGVPSLADFYSKVDPELNFELAVLFYGPSGMVGTTVTQIDPSNPRICFLLLNAEVKSWIGKGLSAKVFKAKEHMLQIVFYESAKVIEGSINKNKVTLKHKASSFDAELPESLDEVDLIRSIHKHLSKCSVVNNVYLGPLPLDPENKVFLVRAPKDVRLSKTQLAKRPNDDYLLLTFVTYNSDGLSEFQMQTVAFQDNNKQCTFDSERSLRFLLDQSTLTVNTADRDLSLIFPISLSNVLSSYTDYKFGSQDKSILPCFDRAKGVMNEKGLCLKLVGFITDLSHKYEEALFGLNANLFNRPLMSFSDKDSLFAFDFATEPGTIDLTFDETTLQMKIDENPLFTARFSMPDIHLKDNLKRYYKIKLHMFVYDLEDVVAEIVFPANQGISHELFEKKPLALKFAIKTNKLPNFQEMLSQTFLRTHLAFAAEVFENGSDELVFVLYEQSNFRVHKLEDFAYVPNKDDHLSFNNQKAVQKKSLKGVDVKTAKALLSAMAAKISDARKFEIDNVNKDRPCKNSICQVEEDQIVNCQSIALFAAKDAGNYFIVASPDSFNKVANSLKPIKLTGLDSRDTFKAFPASESKEVQKLLI